MWRRPSGKPGKPGEPGEPGGDGASDPRQDRTSGGDAGARTADAASTGAAPAGDAGDAGDAGVAGAAAAATAGARPPGDDLEATRSLRRTDEADVTRQLALPGTGGATGQKVRRKRRALRVTGFVTAVVVVLGVVGAVAVSTGYSKLQQNITKIDLNSALGTDRPTQTPTPTSGESAAFNLLVVGDDTRNGKNGFVGGATGAGHSDTTMLLHVSQGAEWATVVSIPRDSMVQIPACTTDAGTTVAAHYGMFNSAYSTGGVACTVRTVEKLTGVRVDHTVVVQLYGFKKMVDALGGVWVCSSTSVHSYGVTVQKGRHKVNGKQALAYVRARHGLGDGSDIGRLARQQAFVSSVLQTLTSAGTLTNPTKLYKFLDAATESLEMDTDLAETSNLLKLASAVQSIGLKNISFLTVPTAAYSEDANRLVWTSAADTVWKAVRNDRRIVSEATATSSTSTTSKAGSTGTATKKSTKKSTTKKSSSAATSSGSSSVELDGVTIRTAKTNICNTGS